MRRGWGLVAGLAMTLALANAPARAAVFVNAQIVQAGVDGQIGGDPIGQSRDDASTAPRTIAANAAVVETRGDGQGNSVAVRGTSSVNSMLSSAERGRVTFRQSLSVDRNLAGSSMADLSGSIAAAGSYLYLFTTDAAVQFELNWGVSTSPTPAGGNDIAQVAWLRDRNNADFALYTDALSNGASGTSSTVIGPGSYELRIQDAAPATADDDTGRVTLGSQYSFVMSPPPIPEPATWVMMTLGFGLAGGALRRARGLARA